MKRLSRVALLVALVLAGVTGAYASHSWNNYHWARTSNPFSLRIVDSLTGTWDSLLPAVSADWGASSVLNTSIEGGSSGLLQRLLCSPVAGKIHVCSASYGPTGWFGVAQVWIANGHIAQATTRVNDFYFTGTYGNNTARRHVLCQEVGHDLGLDHQKQQSCMDDTNSTLNDPAYLDPNAHDYEQLQIIYSHLDSISTTRAQSSSSIIRPDRVERIGAVTILTFVRWVR